MRARPRWPDGKSFAFTVFDDPDSQTLAATEAVYSFLRDCGLRTTKAVWPCRGSGIPSDHGITCADSAEYLAWLQTLQSSGFEIAFHNATSHTSRREDTIVALERFVEHFGHNPKSMANHYFCEESVYWGDSRVSGVHRLLYNVLTLGKNRGKSYGHVPGHPYFWGDLCRERIKYVRNFVYGGINTLKACPPMPYRDPLRPYVNFWYAGSEGSNIKSFVATVNEANQDRLEAEGGACIMYAHFGHGFYEGRALDARFRSLMERLARRSGWFVPVSTLLDYLLSLKTSTVISDSERRQLERRWLLHKVRFGTA